MITSKSVVMTVHISSDGHNKVDHNRMKQRTWVKAVTQRVDENFMFMFFYHFAFSTQIFLDSLYSALFAITI